MLTASVGMLQNWLQGLAAGRVPEQQHTPCSTADTDCTASTVSIYFEQCADCAAGTCDTPTLQLQQLLPPERWQHHPRTVQIPACLPVWHTCAAAAGSSSSSTCSTEGPSSRARRCRPQYRYLVPNSLNQTAIRRHTLMSFKSCSCSGRMLNLVPCDAICTAIPKC
jgi:hypothetical protein